MAIISIPSVTKIKRKDRKNNWSGTNTIKQQAYNAYKEFLATKKGMLYSDDEKSKVLFIAGFIRGRK